MNVTTQTSHQVLNEIINRGRGCIFVAVCGFKRCTYLQDFANDALNGLYFDALCQ